MTMAHPARAGLALVVALAAAGCSDRPHAPRLSNDPVYQNDTIGVRFLAPEGWSIVSRSELPPGTLPRPVVMATYVQSKGERPAEFELMAADLPDGADLGQYLAENRIGPEKWAVKSAGQPVTVNGVAATRYTLARGSGRNEFRREVTAFRRGGRVYFFIITFGVSDPENRDQARKSVESVTWK